MGMRRMSLRLIAGLMIFLFRRDFIYALVQSVSLVHSVHIYYPLITLHTSQYYTAPSHCLVPLHSVRSLNVTTALLPHMLTAAADPFINLPTSIFFHSSLRSLRHQSRRSLSESLMAHLADALKEKGNELFKSGDFIGAEARYTAAITKYSRNPLLFTNRAFARIKLQRWDGVVDDCLHSIELTGGQGFNFKAYFYLGKPPIQPYLFASSLCVVARTYIYSTSRLARKRTILEETSKRTRGKNRYTVHTDIRPQAQAQLALNHPNEALASALTAYTQVLHPPPGETAKATSNLSTVSSFVLTCKRAKFAARERDRLRRRGDILAELEESLDANTRRTLDSIASSLEAGRLGVVEASEQREEALLATRRKLEELRSVFAIADPLNHQPREVPDYLVDTITFEIMHDPVLTRTGHSYERATLHEHLKRSPTDPLTREVLTIADLRPNVALRQVLEEFWRTAGSWAVDW